MRRLSWVARLEVWRHESVSLFLGLFCANSESLVDLVWNTNLREEAFNNPRPLTQRPTSAQARKSSYDRLRPHTSGSSTEALVAKMESLDTRELRTILKRLQQNYRSAAFHHAPCYQQC